VGSTTGETIRRIFVVHRIAPPGSTVRDGIRAMGGMHLLERSGMVWAKNFAGRHVPGGLFVDVAVTFDCCSATRQIFFGFAQ